MTRTASSHQKPGEAWTRFPLRASRRCQPGQHLCSNCWLAFPGHVLSRDGQFLSASSPCSGLEYPPRRSPTHRCGGSCCQRPQETAGEISLEVLQTSVHSPNFVQTRLSSLILQLISTFWGSGRTGNFKLPPGSTHPQTPTSSTRFAVLPSGLQWSL